MVTEAHANLNEDQLVVIDRDSQAETSLSDFYVSQAKLALARGQRLVPEREISLAILSSTCQRYCNPRYVSVSTARGEQKITRKTEREAEQEADTMDIDQPPSKRQKCASIQEPMEVVEPPSKKLKTTSSNEAPISKVISKFPFHFVLLQLLC